MQTENVWVEFNRARRATRRNQKDVAFEVVGECWICTSHSGIGHGGYPRVREPGGKLVGLSRVAYKLSTGKDLGSLDALHSCDNPPCINPAHIFAGTHADNMRDAVSKGRQARGESIRSGRLTTSAVIQLRRDRQAGAKLNALAAKYGVTVNAVFMAAKGYSWAHVEGSATRDFTGRNGVSR